MSITTESIYESAMNDEAYVQQLHIVKVGSSKLSFKTANEAAKVYTALQGARTVGGYPALPNIYDMDQGEVQVSIEKTAIQVCKDEALPVDGEFQSFRCDHNIVEASDVCGIKTCYESTNNKGTGDYPPEGWHVSSRLDDYDNEAILVTCPKCAQRLADVENCDPSELTSDQLWAQRDFEKTVIERNKG